MPEASSPRIIRQPALRAKTGLKKSSLYSFMQKGEFPRPVSLGARAVGWIESEVDQWIADRISESRGGAK